MSRVSIRAVAVSACVVMASASLAALPPVAAPAAAAAVGNCQAIPDIDLIWYDDNSCYAPGTSGAGRMISVKVAVVGGGGGGGYNGPYSTGGGGALVTAIISVPAGGLLSLHVGKGGGSTGFSDSSDGSGGGGSSAILSGKTLLIEAGGGGGGIMAEYGGVEVDGGSSGEVGAAGIGPCSGAGGGRSGGAAGSTSGVCADMDLRGTAGGNPPNGVGGRGGSSLGGRVATGGGGYHAGGDGGVGDSSSGVMGGGGGGGGYAGGGGGAGTSDDSLSGPYSNGYAVGPGGGGSSYASPTSTHIVTYVDSDNGGYESDGSDGTITFVGPSGPVAVTRTTGTTAVAGATSATVRGVVDPMRSASTTIAYEYSMDPTLSTVLGTGSASPSSASSAGDASVAGVFTGLLPETTYYYRIRATQGDLVTYGQVESFRTRRAGPLSFSSGAFPTKDVGGASRLTITVTNTGSAPAYLEDIVPSGPGILLTGGTCRAQAPLRAATSTLAAGASCTVTLEWPSTSNGVLRGAKLSVTFAGNATSETSSVRLTGTTRAQQTRPTRKLHLPRAIKPGTWTRVVAARVPLTSGRMARATVTCTPLLRSAPMGDSSGCAVVKRDRAWRVLVPSSGRYAVRLVLSAPKAPGYTAYRAVRHWRA